MRDEAKTEPVTPSLNREPQVNIKPITESLTVSHSDISLKLDKNFEYVLQLPKFNVEQESLDAEMKQEIVWSPRSEKEKIKNCQFDLHASTTVLTHLASAKKVENISGTMEISSYQLPIQHNVTSKETELIEKYEQVSNPLLHFISYDSNVVIMNLLCHEEFEKNMIL